MAIKTPIEYLSADERLRLYGEMSGPANALLTILCLHGLTRNGADFGFLVDHLSPQYRVLTADQRGRGNSQRDSDPKNYQPAVYVADMFKLLDQLQIDRVILIGTSMGGIMSLMMTAMQPSRIQAVVLNDIGPEVPASGLKRLRDSLSAPVHIDTWQDAARQAHRVNGLAFPDYGSGDWDAFARRTYREDASGRPVLAYDPAILDGLKATDVTAVPPNLWPLWNQLAATPTLAIRGELSDILSADTFAVMARKHPALRALTIPGRGHAPMLDEPTAVAAIDEFLQGLQN